MEFNTRPRTKYPCSKCSKNVGSQSVQCATCELWVHSRCIPGMTPALFKLWGDTEKDLRFLCPRCACCDDGTYNYRYALQRIAWMAGASLTELTRIAESERLLLKSYRVSVPGPVVPPPKPGPQDPVATQILEEFAPIQLAERYPLAVQGDGNCFFRAVSRGLLGHEDAHLLIRLLTVLEIIEFHDFYDQATPVCRNLVDDHRVVCAEYRSLLRAATKVGEYAEMLHIFGASAALSVAIRTYCPPTVNSEFLSDPMTKKVTGRGVKDSAIPAVTVMWTSMAKPSKASQFVPNHFVVLYSPPAIKDSGPILLEDSISEHEPSKISEQSSASHNLSDLVSLLQSDQNSPIKVAIQEPKFSPQNSPIKVAIQEPKFSAQNSPNKAEIQADQTAETLPETFGHPDATSTPQKEHNSTSESLNVSEVDSEVSIDLNARVVATGGKVLHNAKFMPIDLVLAAITSGNEETPVHDSVPIGDKENVYFLVDDKDNIRRRSKKKKVPTATLR